MAKVFRVGINYERGYLESRPVYVICFYHRKGETRFKEGRRSHLYERG